MLSYDIMWPQLQAGAGGPGSIVPRDTQGSAFHKGAEAGKHLSLAPFLTHQGGYSEWRVHGPGFSVAGCAAGLRAQPPRTTEPVMTGEAVARAVAGVEVWESGGPRSFLRGAKELPRSLSPSSGSPRAQQTLFIFFIASFKFPSVR